MSTSRAHLTAGLTKALLLPLDEALGERGETRRSLLRGVSQGSVCASSGAISSDGSPLFKADRRKQPPRVLMPAGEGTRLRSTKQRFSGGSSMIRRDSEDAAKKMADELEHRLEELAPVSKSKSDFPRRKGHLRTLPARRQGWLEESEKPVAATRSLSAVSTSASSQEEGATPKGGSTWSLHSRHPRHTWLADLPDAPSCAASPSEDRSQVSSGAATPLLPPSRKISVTEFLTVTHLDDDEEDRRTSTVRKPNKAATWANSQSRKQLVLPGSCGNQEPRPLSAAPDLPARPAGLARKSSSTKPPESPGRFSGPAVSTRKVIKPLECKIYDLFSWDRVLQEEGNGGKVVICRPKGHSELPSGEYVLKMTSRLALKRFGLEEQFRQVQERMLNMPSHPNVVNIHEVWEDDSFFYVVMDKVSGGSLFGSLANDFKDGCMPAAAVKQVMRDILEAVKHVHGQGMLHRDIKPDNLVMQLPGGAGFRGATRALQKSVVLVDFDHAHPDWSPAVGAKELGQVFGTLRFNAPEVIRGNFSPQGDLYSVGVILYLLMTGCFPFEDDVYSPCTSGMPEQVWSRQSMRAVEERMREARVNFESGPWLEQPHCADLCRRLLDCDPKKRPSTAREALQHPWFEELPLAAKR